MNEWVQIVAQFGFPIALACYLLYDRAKSDALHREETKEMAKAIENNTSVMTKILEHIRKAGE